MTPTLEDQIFLIWEKNEEDVFQICLKLLGGNRTEAMMACCSTHLKFEIAVFKFPAILSNDIDIKNFLRVCATNRCMNRLKWLNRKSQLS
jgi:hypothetical protein